MKLLLFVLMPVFLNAPAVCHAWGDRGHHVICAVATRLVQEKGLQDHLKNRTDPMGALCNIPDHHWKYIQATSNIERPTHYIDPEVLGLTAQSMGLRFSDLIKIAEGKEFGSLWWRAEQFYKLAVKYGLDIQQAEKPTSQGKKMDWDDPYHHAVQKMTESMGFLGHFVGDASMPYHNTKDYDGVATGHKGIHVYFESISVNEMGLDLSQRVFKAAQKFRTSKGPASSVLEKMKALSIAALADLKKIETLDPIRKTNLAQVERFPPPVGARKFDALIIRGLARSSALLAELWDQAYIQAGRPDLSGFKIYRPNLMPEFIAPDYMP